MITPESGSFGFPEPGRQAMHVLLDTLSVWRADDADQSEAVMDRALERLDQIGAVTMTVDDETLPEGVDVSDLHLDMDASNLVGGMLGLLQLCVTSLAACHQCGREKIIVKLRELADS